MIWLWCDWTWLVVPERIGVKQKPLCSRPRRQSFRAPQPKCISGTRRLLKAAAYILSFRKSLLVTATSQWLQDKRHTPSDAETSRGSCCTAMTNKTSIHHHIFRLRSRVCRSNEKAGQDPFERSNHVSKSISEAKFYIQAFKGIIWLSEVVRRKWKRRVHHSYLGFVELRKPRQGQKQGLLLFWAFQRLKVWDSLFLFPLKTVV